MHRVKPHCPYCVSDNRIPSQASGICWLTLILLGFLFVRLEPVGSVKPKVVSKTIEFVDHAKGSLFAMLCPGQAFPVPVYRYSRHDFDLYSCFVLGQ